MNNTATKIPQCLIWPVAICFLVGKIVTFPTYVILRGVGRFWNAFFAELWEDWYWRT